MWQKAQAAALEAAAKLEQEARQIGILRSVDATQASAWLREIAASIRDAAGPVMPSPGDERKGGAHG